MATFTLVEPSMRRKMEELLHTWKQPAPGGHLSPLFANSVIQRIEVALDKAQKAILQLRDREEQERFRTNDLYTAPNRHNFGVHAMTPHTSGVVSMNGFGSYCGDLELSASSRLVRIHVLL